MAFDTNLWELYMGTVCSLDQLLRCLPAALDNLLGVALEKDLAHSVDVRIMLMLALREMPRRIEGVCKG